MRNTLKFSLFGTVLCAVCIMFSTGYSMEYSKSMDNSPNLSNSSESEDEFMDRVGKIIKAANKNGAVILRKDGAMKVGRFGTVTKAEMDRYNEIMKKRDEELKLIGKVEKFYEDTKNNEYTRIDNMLIGNALKSSITVDEDKRYNEIMKKRDEELKLIKKVEKFYEDTENNNYVQVGNMLIGNALKSSITVDEDKRYNKIMKKRDEELIRKVEKFYEDTKNNEYMRIDNRLIGNALKSSITVDEDKRYNEIMDKRNTFSEDDDEEDQFII